jgi:hypothetical protein
VVALSLVASHRQPGGGALQHHYSQGSYGQFCGMLAACLGRWDDAERHFTDALEMNGK